MAPAKDVPDDPFARRQWAFRIHLSLAGEHAFGLSLLLITHVNILHEERGFELQLRQKEEEVEVEAQLVEDQQSVESCPLGSCRYRQDLGCSCLTVYTESRGFRAEEPKFRPKRGVPPPFGER